MPFYERKQMRWQSYGRLVYGWLVENRAPHTDWSRNGRTREAAAGDRLFVTTGQATVPLLRERPTCRKRTVPCSGVGHADEDPVRRPG